MSISSDKTLQIFTGDGSTVSFNFSNIIYFEGESSTVLKVYLDDVLQASGYTITEGTATNGLVSGGTLDFTAAPANGVKVKIQRETARTQPTSFGSSYSQGSIEDAHDRAIMISQEIQEQGTDQSGSSSSSATPVNAKFPDWVTNEDYKEDQVVVVKGEGNFFEDSVYRATADHTSSSFATDFGNNLWEEIIVKGEKGDTGATGPKGSTGDTGAKGDQGIQGPAGSDGVFSEIATQGEAEAGANNTKGMTPLRVKNAIDDQVPDLTEITTLQSDLDTAETTIAENTTRIAALEGTSDKVIKSGKQRINNNQSSALDVDSASGQNGSGDIMNLDADGAKSARIELEFYRKDDSETRYGIINLRLLYNTTTGNWGIGRESTVIFEGAPDGLTFSVDQTAEVAQVQYVSDNMSGGNYDSDSYMKWRLVEISNI